MRHSSLQNPLLSASDAENQLLIFTCHERTSTKQETEQTKFRLLKIDHKTFLQVVKFALVMSGFKSLLCKCRLPIAFSAKKLNGLKFPDTANSNLGMILQIV